MPYEHGPLWYIRIQPTEPTDVGPGVVWIDTSTAPHPIKVRGDVSWSDAGIVAGSGDVNYTHTQAVAATTWNIVHNRGKNPSVTVVDSSDNVIYGDIQHVDNNELNIRFAAAESGKAYLN